LEWAELVTDEDDKIVIQHFTGGQPGKAHDRKALEAGLVVREHGSIHV